MKSCSVFFVHQQPISHLRVQLENPHNGTFLSQTFFSVQKFILIQLPGHVYHFYNKIREQVPQTKSQSNFWLLQFLSKVAGKIKICQKGVGESYEL